LCSPVWRTNAPICGAAALYREALELGWKHHDRLCLRMALPCLAGVAAMDGDAPRALRLASAASTLEENAGMWAFPLHADVPVAQLTTFCLHSLEGARAEGWTVRLWNG